MAAFSVRFARTYFSEGGAALKPFIAHDLSDDAAILLRRGPGARVAWAMVAREVPLGNSRALITVATTLSNGVTRYLTVPIAKDRYGGLSVFDLPSLSPPPPQGDATAPEVTPLTGSDAPAIGVLVKRFLHSYVAGVRPAELTYLLAPGARVTQMSSGLSVDDVRDIGQLGQRSRRLRVMVHVTVKDKATGATYPLRYRMALVRRDRWLVETIAGGPLV